MPASSRNRAVAALIITMMLWSSNAVAVRAIEGAIPPFALGWLRWGIVVLVLAWVARGEWPAIRAVWRRERGLLVTLALLGTVPQNMAIYKGLETTTAINVGLLNSAIPVLVLLLAWLWLKRPAYPRQVAGVALSLVGVLLLITHGELARLAVLDVNKGDLYALVGMVIWAFYTLKLPERPLELSPWAFMFLIGVIGLVLTSPFIVGEALVAGLPQWSVKSATLLAYIALGPALIAITFYNIGVEGLGPQAASVFVHLVPVFASILSIAFLGETFHLYHAVGFALVAGGATLAVRAAAPAQPSPSISKQTTP